MIISIFVILSIPTAFHAPGQTLPAMSKETYAFIIIKI